jgi:predicted permease
MRNAPRFLARLARLLIRGPEAGFVRVDLDDAFERDVTRGIPRSRAAWRYLVNTVLSAGSVLWGRLRGLSWRGSGIDVRLGLRMLIKYPALTLVAVFALAIGLPVSLAPLHFADVIEGELPEDPDGRIRLLRYWNGQTTADDLTAWRTSLSSFTTLAAMRSGAYNVEARGVAQVVPGAEVTASVFDMLGTPPMLGREFGPADEVVGAPAVAIIGHDLWQVALEGQRDLSGRTIRIGDVSHAVVGVMPDGFFFPQRQQVWLPLRDRAGPGRGAARVVTILGQLAPGRSADEAHAELVAVAGVIPEGATEADRLIPEVVPTAYMTFGFARGGLRATPDFLIAQVVTVVPLLVACLNVGLLIFARTATRTSEFAVRTALGATRSRILLQVFTESLVLSMIATGVGLCLLGWLPARALTFAGITLPYWIDPGLTTATVVRGLMFGGLSAAIAGVIPAVRATRGSVQSTIQRAHADRSGVRFGGRSSALIIADVAVAVAVVGFAAALLQQVRATAGSGEGDGVQAAHFLSFELRTPVSEPSRRAATEVALAERLRAEPAVRAVAVGSVLPRMEHPTSPVEVEGRPGERRSARRAAVAPSFFEDLGHAMVLGRAFDQSDLRPGAATIIVNRSFVTAVLGDVNPIGQRVRLHTWNDRMPPSPWHEIVGVVGHLGMRSVNPESDQGIYLPLVPGSTTPVRMAVEIGPDPLQFAPRLRAIARDVDPQAVIASVSTLDQQFEGDWYIMAALVAGGLLLVGVLLTLASSGIYAIMSFTVAQRTREIGIRVALGADRWQVVRHVARRALVQIGIGVALGMTIAGWIFFELQRDADPGRSAALALVLAIVPGVAIMVGVGLVACAAPTLRALRISPIEALRAD